MKYRVGVEPDMSEHSRYVEALLKNGKRVLIKGLPGELKMVAWPADCEDHSCHSLLLMEAPAPHAIAETLRSIITRNGYSALGWPKNLKIDKT